MKKIISTLFLLVSMMSAIFADFSHLNITSYFNGLADDSYDVELVFVVSGNAEELIVTGDSSTIELSDVSYVDGYASIALTGLDPDVLATANLYLNISIVGSTYSDTLEFQSAAYGIYAMYAETVAYPDAESLVSTSVFENVVTLSAGIQTYTSSDTQGLSIFTESPYIFDGKGSSDYDIDWLVDINVSEAFYRNGELLSDSFDWQLGDNGLYFYGNAGIGIERSPDHDLEVAGRVVADEFLVNGGRFSSLEDWSFEDEDSDGSDGNDNLYFAKTSGYLGIGESNPVEMVHVGGGILLLTSNYQTLAAGTIYRDASTGGFFGVVYDSEEDVTKSIGLDVLSANGATDYLALFEADDSLGYDADLVLYQEDEAYQKVRFIEDDAFLSLYNASGTLSGPYLNILSNDSAVIVSMNVDNQLLFADGYTVPEDSIAINGTVNASNYYLDGAPIVFRMSVGDIFLRSEYGYTETSASIYYDDGFVSIGGFDPNSVLELQAPYVEFDSEVVTKDPIISFSMIDGDSVERYSMGLDADELSLFLIEYGDTLGSDAPLLAIQQDYISVGNKSPEANLHVSGNLGLLMEGSFDFFSDESGVTESIEFFEDPGTKMVFNAYNSSFRAGTFAEEELYFSEVGLGSIGFGENNSVFGTFATNYSGYLNNVVGAYSMGLSGYNNQIDGYFSWGMGVGATIDHDGSFVFSQPGILGSGSVSSGSSFSTSQHRQFLIGNPTGDSVTYMNSSVGINTSDANATLTMQGKGLTWQSFQNEFDFSDQDAQALFDHLVDIGVLDDSDDTYGFLQIPDKQYFKDSFEGGYYLLPLIFTIESDEFYADLIQTIKDEGYDDETEILDLIETDFLPDSELIKPYITNAYEGTPDLVTTEQVGFFDLWVTEVLVENSKYIADIINDTDLVYSFTGDDGSVYNSYSGDSAEIADTSITSIQSYCENEDYLDLNDEFVTVNIDEVLDSNQTVYQFVYDYISLFYGEDVMLNTTYSPTFSGAELMYIVQQDIESLGIVTTINCFEIVSENMDYTEVYDHLYFNDYDTEGTGVYSYSTYIDQIDDYFDGVREAIYDEVNEIADLTNIDADTAYTLSEVTLPYTMTDQSGNDIVSENIYDFLVEHLQHSVLALQGLDYEQVFTVQNDGKVGVGYTTIDKATLAVSKNVSIFGSYVETDYFDEDVYENYDPKLAIFNPRGVTTSIADDYTMLVGGSLDSDYEFVDDPGFVMNSSGNVGVGYEPTLNFSLSVYGMFYLTSMNMVMSDGSSVEITADEPTIVFDFESTTPNIYFVSGNVGLGTAFTSSRPQSLLHLSTGQRLETTDPSSDYIDVDPLIAFDYDDSDYLILGMNSSDGLILATPYTVENDSAELFLTTQNILFATTNQEIADVKLAVDGNMQVSDVLEFSNNDIDFDSDSIDSGLVLGDVYTEYMFMRSATTNSFTKVTASGLAWNLIQSGDLYLNDGTNIGIGIATPSVDLDVAGTVSANKMVVSDTLIASLVNLSEYLNFYNLKSSDSERYDSTLYPLYYLDNELIFDGGGYEFSLSELLTLGSGSGGNIVSYYGEGDDAILTSQNTNLSFVWDSEFDTSGFYWEYSEDDETFYVSGDFPVTGSSTLSLGGSSNEGLLTLDIDSEYIDNSILFTTPPLVGIQLDSSITYDGFYWTDSYAHSFVSFNLEIIGNDTDESSIADARYTALSVQLNNQDETGEFTTLASNTEVFGLYISTEEVVVQDDGDEIRGYRYPAIFMGDVMMGKEVNRDLDELEDSSVNLLSVDGSVLADSFNITDRLITSYMNIANSVFIDSGTVGVGIEYPSTELEVVGSVEVTNTDVGILYSDTFVQADDKFVVTDKGFVGFGTDSDTDSVDVVFSKSFQTYDDYIFAYKYYDLINETGDKITNNVTLYSIDINTADNNFFGSDEGNTIIGMDVDLSELDFYPDGTIDLEIDNVTSNIYGMYVDVNEDYSGNMASKVVAAVFLNGSVGIGVTQPDRTYALEVNGDIQANSVDSTAMDNLATVPDYARIDSLDIPDSLEIAQTVTINNIYTGKLSYSAAVLSNLYLPENFITVNYVSVEATMNIEQSLVFEEITESDYFYFSTANLDLLYSAQSSSIYDFNVEFGVNAHSASLNSLSVDVVTINDLISISDDYFSYNLKPNDYYNLYSAMINFPAYGDIYSADNVKSWNAFSLFSNTSNVNTYVGAILTPFDDATDIDSAKWAIMSNLESSYDGGSDAQLSMKFMSVDVDSDGNETMNTVPALYIDPTGNVGINTLVPSVNLDINGSASMDTVTLTGNINFEGINLYSNSRIDSEVYVAADSTFEVASINTSLQLVSLNPTTYDTTFDESISLYYNEEDDGFYIYRDYNSEVATADLTLGEELVEGTFVYFSSKNILESLELYYSTSNAVYDYQFFVQNTFSATGNATSLFALDSVVGADDVFEDDTLFKSIYVQVGKRDTVSDGLYGLDIELVSTGNLAGVDVDLSDLLAKTSMAVYDDTSLSQGARYAALFNGGGIIISSRNTYAIKPQSSFWVDNQDDGNKIASASVIVDSYKTSGIVDFLITTTGNLGLGVSSSNVNSQGGYQIDSQFVISNNTSLDQLLTFYDSTLGLTLSFNDDGQLNFGSQSADSGAAGINLMVGDLKGNVDATKIIIDEFNLNSWPYSENLILFVDEADGFVGFGVTDATAQFDLYTAVDQNVDFISQEYNLDLNQDSEALALGIELTATGNTSVAGTAYGLKFGESLTLGDDGVMHGVYATVSENTLVFVTGNVGIGVKAPSYPLEVAGTIYAQDVISVSSNVTLSVTDAQSDRVNVSNLTVSDTLETTNNILVSDTFIFSNIISDITLDELIATYSMSNEFDGVSVEDTLFVTTLNVGGHDTQYVMYVSENTTNGIVFSDTDSSIDVLSGLNVADIAAIDTTITVSDNLIVNQVTANQLGLYQLLLQGSNTTVDTNDAMSLVVDANGDLIYGAINVVEYLNSTNSNRFVYYDSNGDVNDQFDFSYVDGTTYNSFIVSSSISAASTPLLQLLENVDKSTDYGATYAFKQIDMDINSQTDGIDVYGYAIELNSKQFTTGDSYFPADTIGLSIDLGDLETYAFEIDEGAITEYEGTRYSATFLGGSVLITSSNAEFSTTLNSAVVIENTSIPSSSTRVSASMIVDADSTSDLLDFIVTTRNTGLGILAQSGNGVYDNTLLESTQLLVSSNEVDSLLVSLLKYSGTEILSIGQSGVVVLGSTQDTSGDLGIDASAGTVEADSMIVDSLLLDGLSDFDGYWIEVGSNGIGINNNSPAAMLDTYILIDEDKSEIAQKIDINVSVNYTGYVLGYEIQQLMADDLVSSGKSYGLRVDDSDLQLGDDGLYYGIQVDAEIVTANSEITLTFISGDSNGLVDSDGYIYTGDVTDGFDCPEGSSFSVQDTDSEYIVSCEDNEEITVNFTTIYSVIEESFSYDCSVADDRETSLLSDQIQLKFYDNDELGNSCQLVFEDPQSIVFATGNVGIGVLQPSYALEVDGTIYAEDITSVSDNVTVSVTDATVDSVNATKLTVSDTFEITNDITVLDNFIFSELMGDLSLDELVATQTISNEFDGVSVENTLLVATLNVGDSDAQYAMYVSENFTSGIIFSNANSILEVLSSLNVGGIEAIDSTIIVSNNLIAAQVTSNQLSMYKLLLPTTSINEDTNQQAQLRVDDSGDLLYGSNNLTQLVLADNDNAFVYYDSNQDVSNSIDFHYVSNNYVDGVAYDSFIVSSSITAASTPLIELLESVDESTDYGAIYTFKQIDMDITSQADGIDVYGHSIELNSKQFTASDSYFPAETIGLSIDLGDLETYAFEIDEGSTTEYEGTRYSATLIGGSVLITSSNAEFSTTLNSTVVIENTSIQSSLTRVSASMIVDADSTSDLLDFIVTTRNTGLGILAQSGKGVYDNTLLETVQFLVSYNQQDSLLMSLENDLGSEVLSVGQTGAIVLGSVEDTAGDLGIDASAGTVEGTQIIADTLNTDTLSVFESDSLYIDATGLGIGTNTLEAQLDSYVLVDTQKDYVAQITKVLADGSVASLSETLIGQAIDLNVADNTVVGGNADGLYVDFTDLDLTDDGVIYGVSLISSINRNSQEATQNYSLVFVTGNVGIGVINPAYALDIDGYIDSDDFIVEGKEALLNVTSANLEALEVTTTLSGEGNIDLLSITQTVLIDTLEFSNYNSDLVFKLDSLYATDYNLGIDNLIVTTNMIVVSSNLDNQLLVGYDRSEYVGFSNLYDVFPVAFYVSQNITSGIKFDNLIITGSLEIAPEQSGGSSSVYTITTAEDSIFISGNVQLTVEKNTVDSVVSADYVITDVINFTYPDMSSDTSFVEGSNLLKTDGTDLYFESVTLNNFFSVEAPNSTASYYGAIPFFDNDSASDYDDQELTYDNHFKIISANNLISKSVFNQNTGSLINTVFTDFKYVWHPTLFLGNIHATASLVSQNFDLAVSINSVVADFVLQEIDIEFANRITSNILADYPAENGVEFIGLDVVMTQVSDQGTLGSTTSDRTYYGVVVSMNHLMASYYDTLFDNGETSVIGGTKVAGAFTGGQFMVVGTGNMADATDVTSNYAPVLSSLTTLPYVNVYVSSNVENLDENSLSDFLISSDNVDETFFRIGATSNVFSIDFGFDSSDITLQSPQGRHASKYMMLVSGNSDLMTLYNLSNQLAFGVFDEGVSIAGSSTDVADVDFSVSNFITNQSLANFSDTLYIGTQKMALNTTNYTTLFDVVNSSAGDFLQLSDSSGNSILSITQNINAKPIMIVGDVGKDIAASTNNNFQFISYSNNPLVVTSLNYSTIGYLTDTQLITDFYGGFLAQDDGFDDTFLLMHNISTHNYSGSQIVYGNSTSDAASLQIDVNGVDVLTFGNVNETDDYFDVLVDRYNNVYRYRNSFLTQNVGVFVDEPLATLHVDQSSSSVPYFHVITDKSTFYIDSGGNVGVNTTSPSTNFHVNGKMLVGKAAQDQRLIIATGNQLSIIDQVVTVNDFITYDGIIATDSITAGTDFVGSDINFTLETISSVNITGVVLDFSENINGGVDPLYNTISSTADITGLYVDMSDLYVDDDATAYSAIFYGTQSPTDTSLSSKFVIDLTSLYASDLHKNTYRRNQDCADNPKDTCRDNIYYKYQLNVYPVSTGNINYRSPDYSSDTRLWNHTLAVPYAVFETATDNVTVSGEKDNLKTRLYFQEGLSEINNLNYDYNVVENSSFVNLFSSTTGLVSNVNEVRVALEDAGIISSTGVISTSDLIDSLYERNAILDDTVAGVSSRNILAAVNSLVTKNVFNMMVRYTAPTGYYDVDTICVNPTENILDDDGTINLEGCVENSNGNEYYTHTHWDLNSAPYTDTVTNKKRERRFYPFAISSGTRPTYLSGYNVGQVAINVVTNNLTLADAAKFSETRNVTFNNEALIVGGGIGSGIVDPEYTVDGQYYYDDDTFFTKDNGFFDNWSEYKDDYADNLAFKQQFTETDQHVLSIIADSSQMYRYLSYKTRFQDMRLGEYLPYLSSGTQENDEVDIYFSGGICYSDVFSSNPDDCSENGDEFTMGRENNPDSDSYPTPFQSKLVVNMTDSNSVELNTQFQVGYSIDDNVSTFNSVLAVGGGPLGGTGASIPFMAFGDYWTTVYGEEFPETLLSIIDSTVSSEATEVYNYMVKFQNKSSSVPAGVLALDFSAIDAPDESQNYMSFMVNTAADDSVDPVYEALGEIEGYGGDDANIAGVQFSSPGNDYAEYILKRDPKEELKPGDVVGVFAGRLSLQTQGADHVMVISSSPIIVGNYPGEDVKHLYGLAAFLGQVKVRVVGDVNHGDILVASMLDNGTAVGISEDQLKPEHMPYILGQAWEATTKENNNMVNAVIGLPFNTMIINKYIDTFSTEIENEKLENQDLEQLFQQQLQQQQQLIDVLKKSLTSLDG